MKKTFQIIMLPTKSTVEAMNKSHLILEDSGKLNYIENPTHAKWGHQHLYFVSSEDEIKEGDWTFANGTPYKVLDIQGDNYKTELCWVSNCKKIIASTDKSITPNSWIPDSYVKWYVEKANDSGVPVDLVNLEMIESADVDPNVQYNDLIPKLNPDGSIILAGTY